MVLSMQSIIELKNKLNSQCGLYLHVSDACGGQSFWFEEIPNSQAVEIVCDFIERLGGTARFSEDKKRFSVK